MLMSRKSEVKNARMPAAGNVNYKRRCNVQSRMAKRHSTLVFEYPYPIHFSSSASFLNTRRSDSELKRSAHRCIVTVNASDNLHQAIRVGMESLASLPSTPEGQDVQIIPQANAAGSVHTRHRNYPTFLSLSSLYLSALGQRAHAPQPHSLRRASEE